MSRLDAIHILLAHLEQNDRAEYKTLIPELLAAFGYEGVSDAFEGPTEVPAQPPRERGASSMLRPHERGHPTLHLETFLYH